MKGILDLRSPLVIRDTTTSEETTVTAVEIGKSAIVSTSLVEFYCDIISAMDDNGYCFANNANLTTLKIGGSAETLPAMSFKGSSITNVVLDLTNLDTIAANAFSGQLNVRRVELVTRLADMGLVSNVVASVFNNNLGTGTYLVNKVWQPNNLRIYVSKKQWTPTANETYDAEMNPTGFFLGKDTFTDTEKAMIAADPTLEKAFGVLVVKNGANVVRKAFFVHKRSVHDQQSLVIRIR